jgi:putative two-component system response regulator
MTETFLPTILVVDDNEANIDILSEALIDDCEISVAMDGLNALTVARETRPDLILLDILMPGMDGYDVCIELKSSSETRDIPIIFLSALQETAHKVRGLSLGAVDYITKPFAVNEVRARVCRQLELLEDRRQLIAQGRRKMLETSQRGLSSTERAERIRQTIAGGENDFTEFKSTLRWNIRKGDRDPAIEAAWLKTVVAFLNSAGGTLLVGVADDGTPVGLELDGFKNDDKCQLHVNGRIQQNIGMEFASSIRYSLEGVDDKQVLIVECSPAAEPAFLLDKDGEHFYVRVGPGSRKLTPRQTLSYLAQRKKERAS